MSSVFTWVRRTAGYDTADEVAEDNAQQILKLQKEYETNMKLAHQYELNAVRLANAGNRQGARDALARKKTFQGNADLISGKIATLSAITTELRGMDSNVEMTASIAKSNAVTARMAGKLSVDRVDTVMDEALDHKFENKEISDRLAGAGFVDPIDEDDADAELDALMKGANLQDPLHPANAPVDPETRRVPDPRAPPETHAQKAAREEEVLRRAATADEILNRMPPAPTRVPGSGGGKTLPSAIKTKGPK